MALIDRTGFIHDSWTSLEDDEALSGEGAVLVSLARFLGAQREYQGKAALGVRIANDVPASALADRLDEIDLISIEFPSSGDGRGFSLARQLRQVGFAGELRASGPLIADQFAFALACGFDTVAIPADMAARQPEAQWLAALRSIGSTYQAHYGAATGQSILERRFAARRAPHSLAA